MADDADRADARIENMIADGMARVRQKMERSLPAIGCCHWCAETILNGRIFCSRECSDDFQRDKEGRIRNGDR